jgi:hypothetical protein
MIGMHGLDLLSAVRSKAIRFRAWASNSFREMLLHLKNEGLTELQIDVSRSGLKAKMGKSQIIGLSYPVGSSPGHHVLVLGPGEEKEIIINSRCLDKAEQAPKDGIEFELVPEFLAGYVIELLRQGADQEKVWDSIEDRRGEIIARPAIPAMVDKFD